MNRKPMKSPRALGRKAISQTEKFWIPENLKLEWILKQNPPEFKFRRDKALYLLNYIVTIDAKCPHFRTKKGLIRLSSKILEQSVKDYNKYMEYFEATGIIVCDHKYQKGLFCKGYMLAPEYDERPLKQVSIESGSIARPLLKKIESSPRQDDLAYSPLRSSLERVRIDKNAEIFRQVEYQLLIENPELAKKKSS